MEEIVANLVATVLNGGTSAVLAMSFIVIVMIWYDRQRLIADSKRNEERMEKFTQDQIDAAKQVAEAINLLRMAVIENKCRGRER